MSRVDKPIETSRLLLEPLTERHADLLYDGLRDARLYEFTDDALPRSAEDLRRRYASLESRRSPDGSQIWLNWAIRVRDDSSYAGYVQSTLYEDGSASIGYVVFVPAWNRGYGREAVSAMLTELREVYDVERATATVDRRNAASLRLLTALSFSQVESGESGVTSDAEFEKELV